MAKFCGKCGTRLDETTGLCPNCDADKLKRESGLKASEDILRQMRTENRELQGRKEVKEKRQRQQRKDNKKRKKTGNRMVKGVLLGAVLILLGIGGVEALVYMGVVNIPGLRQSKTDSNTLANITEFQALSDGFTDRKIEDKESALEAIDDISETIGIKDVTAVFSECKEDTVLDNTYYRFEQEYQGIPVYGRSVIISADKDGNSLILSGNYLDVDGTETKPEIDSSEAVSIVQEKYSEEETTIFNEGLTIYSLDENTPELTWQVFAENSNMMEYCFVSAISGDIIEEMSLCATESGESVEASGQDVDGVKQKFTTLKVGNEYLLKDIKRGIHIYDAGNTTVTPECVVTDSQNKLYVGKDKKWIDESGNEVTIDGENFSYVIKDVKGRIVGTNGRAKIIMGANLKSVTNGSTVWENQKAVTAMSRTAVAYDFWKQEFKRNGYDDKDGLVLVAYNDHMKGDTENASSWGDKELYARVLLFGTDNPLSLDTVAHEYTHAVENSISGMNYKGESGALMEGYSDIFGEIVEDWYDNGEFDGSCDWNICKRDLKSPSQSEGGEYPDTYHGSGWKDTNDEWDNGGVHDNSTVISHAAYLMWTGIGGHVAYEALGTKQIAELFYQTLYSLPTDCTFSEFRTLLQNTANIMWKQGKLSEKQYWCVSNAMFQVGILPAPAEYKVSRDFKLDVYDINKNLYDNYSVKISRLAEKVKQGPELKQDEWEDVTYEVDTSEPLPVSLDLGVYKIEIIDNVDESNVYTLYIETLSKGEKKTIDLYTIFGTSQETAEQTGIPADAAEFNGHHYYVYNLDEITTWKEAKEYCESKGGYLATITSREENDFVYSYLKNNFDYESAYFGFTDQEEEGVWVWDNGESGTFTNWHAGEPNDENPNEDYAMYYYKYPDGTWNDGDFGDQTVNSGRVFICEWGKYRTTSSTAAKTVNDTEIWNTFLQEKQYEPNITDWTITELQYCLLDIDQDGRKELILTPGTAWDDFQIYQVYTIGEDGKIYLADDFTACYGISYSSKYKALAYNSSRPSEMSASLEYYAMDGTKMTESFAVNMEVDLNTYLPVYNVHNTIKGTDTTITEDEYEAYQKECTPLTEWKTLKSKSAKKNSGKTQTSDQEWKTAYAQFLRNGEYGSDMSEADKARFFVYDVDGDGSMELVIISSTFSVEGGHVYTLVNEKVVHAGETCGTYGSFASYPSNGLILSSYGHMGTDLEEYYALSDGKLVSQARWISSYTDGETWYLNDQETTQEAYETWKAEHVNGEIFAVEYQDAYPITEENIQAYVK